MFSSLKVALASLVIMSIMAGMFYWYYSNSQKTIAALNKSNATLELSVGLNEQTIKIMQEDFAKVSTELKTVNTEFQDARNQNAELQDRLSKHDLGVLAAGKPKLVERVINNASEKAARCFELLSGSQLTAEERNATSANSFNSECPWLWQGR